MMWVGFLIVFFYFCAIVALYLGYHRVLYFSVVGEAAKTKFSVIVPFRNEAENLSRLLQTLQQLHYPTSHFEVIFVNDASTDSSEEVILQQLKESKLTFQILQNTPNQPSPKKTAITKAISTATYPWIVTTDADCSVPNTWLEILNEFIQTTNPNCVAMPVAYEVNNSFLHRYQQLDNWSLQAVTVGSFGLGNIVLSNGANFAYTKDAFNIARGFEGNLHIASGDDMFLLEKFKQRTPKKIGYLKSRNAVVTTQPVDTWKELIAQRVRWASKTTKQKSVASKLLGLLIFTMNSLVIALPIVAIFWPTLSIFLITIFLSKICIDFWLLQKSSQFFKKPFPFFNFLGSTVVYPIVTIIVILSSFSGTYLWKERSFKKQQK
jgi:biofilm PGA synthesis N-glycosyltransferase PgaC